MKSSLAPYWNGAADTTAAAHEGGIGVQVKDVTRDRDDTYKGGAFLDATMNSLRYWYPETRRDHRGRRATTSTCARKRRAKT
jgi:hypothetical protein